MAHPPTGRYARFQSCRVRTHHRIPRCPARVKRLLMPRKAARGVARMGAVAYPQRPLAIAPVPYKTPKRSPKHREVCPARAAGAALTCAPAHGTCQAQRAAFPAALRADGNQAARQAALTAAYAPLPAGGIPKPGPRTRGGPPPGRCNQVEGIQSVAKRALSCQPAQLARMRFWRILPRMRIARSRFDASGLSAYTEHQA